MTTSVHAHRPECLCGASLINLVFLYKLCLVSFPGSTPQNLSRYKAKLLSVVACGMYSHAMS